MFRNYLTTTLRHLRRQPAYTALNIVGLAAGLAACLLIGLFVQDERSFDRFHADAEHIYRVEMDVPSGDGTVRWAQAMLTVAEQAAEAFPDVAAYVRLGTEPEPLLISETTRRYEDRFVYAEPSFFDVFDFDVLRGDASELARPYTIVLTRAAAATYFPDTDPLGQTIEVQGRYGNARDAYQVVGIMADPPHNTHLRADFVASHATTVPTDQARRQRTIAHTYLLLRPDADPDAFATKLATLDEQLPLAGTSLHLAPLVDLHLYSDAAGSLGTPGDIRYVWLFSAIALVILLIAGINYTNLATARATRRAREVGVRKAVGAGRFQLAGQFFGESLLLVAGALVCALALAQLLLPLFNALVDRTLALPLGAPWLWLALAGALFGLGLGAGAYPALVLSAFRPSVVLKGQARLASRSSLRKGLVVVQFAAMVALIACTLGIQQQLHYVQNTRLGFDKEQVVVVQSRGGLGTQAGAFKDAVRRMSEVRHVALGSSIPGERMEIFFADPNQIEGQEGREGPVRFDMLYVDEDYLTTLDMALVEGRAFTGTAADEDALLITQTTARELGWTDPLGKTMTVHGTPKTVVGVLADFHMADMRETVGPVLIQYAPSTSAFALVKLASTDVAGSVASLRAVWDRLVPEQPLDYFFLDDHFAAMYRAEQRIGRLFLVFAGLAVLIACLGLIGLAAFTAEQRRKEIGVRKVMGASVAGLVGMLTGDFVRLVGIAFVIAAPAAWWFMQRWLADFAYRDAFGADTLLAAGGLALLLALLSVSVQALHAATADPVAALRHE